MRPGFNTLFVLWMAVLSYGSIRVPAQIAPMPYRPTPPPSAEFTAPGAQGTPGAGPRAMIGGWSLGSELAPTIKSTDHAVRLDPGTSDVVFFFDVRPESSTPLEYRYRLADYDRDWTTTGNHSAHYRHLRPGDYRFEVQARAPGQPWNTPIAGLAVVQRHFFYQTWYFYTLLLIGLAALAIELLRQRDQLLKGQIAMVLEERNRIASDFHDTLMAGLAAISWQLEATAKLLTGFDDRTTRAAQSCDLARKMVAHCQAEARRIIWDLRDSDEMNELLSKALALALATNCSREEIDFSIKVDGDEVPIAPAAVHHLVSIGQEAVNNALRHSGATQILVQLKYESDSLHLSIRDNGCGFHFHEPRVRPGHFGILVMQERARKMGGALQLITAPGAGTEIVLTADFQAIHPLSTQQQRVVHWIGV